MSVIPVASLQCVAQMFAMWLSASMGLYFAISSYSTVGNKWKLQSYLEWKSFFQGKISLEAKGLSNKKFDTKLTELQQKLEALMVTLCLKID